jgi:N-succinyldiaminopimelate aminotransferase
MSVRRLESIPGFNIDRVAAAAGDDPDILRMENLDTDIPPPTAALEATRAAIGEDEANSWLPFSGRDDLKEAVAAYIERHGGPRYDGRREIVITSGEGDAMLDALFCLTDPGDEVVLTDPTYAGMLNRVRLVGATPRLVPLHATAGEWRLDLDALRATMSERTRVLFINNASFPSGWVASADEWDAVVALCRERDLWLLYWGGFEGVLFDRRSIAHPASLPGMRERTVIVGAPSFEQRMIAWRVGWIVAPGELVNDVSRADLQWSRRQRLCLDRCSRRAGRARRGPGRRERGVAAAARSDAPPTRWPSRHFSGGWLVAPARRDGARPRLRRGLSATPYREGRRYADAWLGWRGR